jgi:uroporphyrinogen-III synthase
VTRPEPGAAATAAALLEAGHRPLLSPCLRIEPVPLRLPVAIDAIALTSSQALPALAAAGARIRTLPLFAVGDATAARAHAAGFATVESAAGTATDLAALIAGHLPRGTRLLLAVGAGRSLDLARHLRAAGLRVSRRIAYRARPAESLSDPALAALRAGAVDRVLIFSPATGRHFARLLDRAGLAGCLDGAVIIAISAAAAAPLARLGAARTGGTAAPEIRTAIHPDQKHMLAMVE